MSKRSHHILPLLVAAITVVLFFPAVFHDFVDWDDPIVLRDNPLMAHFSSHALATIWTHPVLGLYTPLSYTLWLVLSAISRAMTGQLDPRLFHGLNIFLHATCAAVVFNLLEFLFENRRAAFFGAVLFAVHPLQVEPVAWVAGMNNLLAGAFALGALNLYVRSIRDRLSIGVDLQAHARPARGAAKRVDRITFILSVLCAVLAMLSKPTAIVLPLLIVVIHRAFFRASWREIIRRTAPYFIIALMFILIGSSAQPAPGIDRPALWQRPFIAGDALAFYITRLILPIHLNIDYGRSPNWLIAQPTLYLNWLIPTAVLVIAFALRRNRWLLAGVLIFFVALLPVLGLRPFDFQNFSTVADRYVYLAMLGPAILVAGLEQFPRWCSDRTNAALRGAAKRGERVRYSVVGNAPAVKSSHRKLTTEPWDVSPIPGTATIIARSHAVIILIPMILLLTVATELRLRDWRNSTALFDRAISLNPRSVAASRVLGYFAAQAGDRQAAERYYLTALSVRPADPLTRHNYASLLNTQGMNAELAGEPIAAESFYRRAIAMDPNAPEPHSNLGRILESKGDRAGAAAEYWEALRFNPNFAPAVHGLRRVELKAPLSP